MMYKRTFESEGILYELVIQDAGTRPDDVHTYTVEGFWCQWSITGKQGHVTKELPVTNDECEVIIFSSLDEAVNGARQFISL